MSTIPDVQTAAAAYIYGYPLVYDLEEVAGFVEGTGGLPVSGAFNTFAAARELLGPETAFVSPNNDTLYLMAMCDVRGAPLVLEVPDTTGRYFVLQFVDAWTNNFAYVGTRTIGAEAARFLLVEAGYDGEVPEGAQVVEAPTGIFSIVGRVQVHGAADLDAVRTVQDRFTLEPLHGDGAVAGVPEPDPARARGSGLVGAIPRLAGRVPPAGRRCGDPCGVRIARPDRGHDAVRRRRPGGR
jgi:hypothetical protein